MTEINQGERGAFWNSPEISDLKINFHDCDVESVTFSAFEIHIRFYDPGPGGRFILVFEDVDRVRYEAARDARVPLEHLARVESTDAVPPYFRLITALAELEFYSQAQWIERY